MYGAHHCDGSERGREYEAPIRPKQKSPSAYLRRVHPAGGTLTRPVCEYCPELYAEYEQYNDPNAPREDLVVSEQEATGNVKGPDQRY